MTDEEIKRRLTDLEDGWTERKPQSVGGDDVRKALVAFANSVPDSEEAILFIGVADDGTPLGVDNPDNTQKNVKKWSDWCYPPIRHTSRVIESNGKRVIAVIVQPDHNRPHFAGPAYGRVGSQSPKANEELFDELIASRTSKLRPLVEAKRKGELVSVIIWHFGNRSAPVDCTVVECTPQVVVFQPKSGGPISADYEQILLGRAAEVAQSRTDWLYAFTASVLGAYCGMRGCEIKRLQWKDVDFGSGLLDIKHSKTPAGWRTPTLNTVCKEALAALRAKAVLINAAAPDHYLFPSQIKNKIDASQHAKSWRSAWRSIRRKAARNDENEVIYLRLERVRFHDLRHTAVTVMAEAGLPDRTIMAQVGHISPEMLKTYSHIRRQALNAAAAALEPSFLRPLTGSEASAEMVN